MFGMSQKSLFSKNITNRSDAFTKIWETNMSSTFTESGECDDEITLVFKKSKKLYASKNFLRYASPVFKAMFDHDWQETKESRVSLTGKNYDDFLEFLLCVHPRILKPITEKNVLRLVEIADEYQVTSIINKCKEVMMVLLENPIKQPNPNGCHYLHQAVWLRPCLRIVAKAHELGYDDVVKYAVKSIAKFGHFLYNEGNTDPSPRDGSVYFGEPHPSHKEGDETLSDIMKDCMNMFKNLSFEIRYKIVAERLLRYDGKSCLKYLM